MGNDESVSHAAQCPEGASHWFPANEPGLCTVIGRHAWLGSSLRYDWPGVTVSFQTVGSSCVWARIDGSRNLFKLTVSTLPEDRVLSQRVLRLDSGVSTVLLAENLPLDVTVCIELVKRTEAQASNLIGQATGVVELEGIYLSAHNAIDAGGRVARGERVIEFIGDSDTAAFGIEGKRTSLMNITSMDLTKQDASKSWVVYVANSFDADPINVSYSGIGAVYNAPMVGVDPMRQIWNRLICADHTTAR